MVRLHIIFSGVKGKTDSFVEELNQVLNNN